MTFSKIRIGSRSLGGRALCFVDVPQPEATALQSVQACAGRLGAADFSPARYAGSSFTYAKCSATQTPTKVFDV